MSMLRRWDRRVVEAVERWLDREEPPPRRLRGLGYAYIRCRHRLLAELLRRDLVWSGAAWRVALAVAAKPGDAIIDAGANLGRVTQEAAWTVGSGGAVLSFEPSQNVAARLRRRVARLGLDWVRIHECALGAHSGIETLHEYDHRDGGASSLRAQQHVGSVESSLRDVEVARLDSFASELAGRRLAIIKIDVEGSEVEVLRGAAGLLQDGRPLLVVEASPLTQAGFGRGVQEVLDAISTLGYHSFLWTASGLQRIATAAQFPANLRRADLIALDPQRLAAGEESLMRLSRARTRNREPR